MKKHCSIAILLMVLISSFQSVGQTAEIAWAATNQGAAVTAQERKFLQLDGQNYYLMLSTKDPVSGSVKLHLICYDKKMQLKYSKEVSLTKSGSNDYISRGYIEIGKDLYAVATRFNKADHTHKLFFMGIDYKTGKTKEIEEKAGLGAESEKKMGSFDVACSPDKSKLAIITTHYADRDEDESVMVAVFDEEMRTLWADKFDLPYQNLKASNNYISVANNGSVYIFKRYQEKAFIKYGLFVIDEKGKKIKKVDYEIDDDLLDYRYFTDVNNSMILTGYYRSASESRAGGTNITGNFYIEVKTDGTVGEQNYNQFPEKMFNLKIKDVINDNTRCIILGEFVQLTSGGAPAPDPNNSQEISSTGCVIVANDDEGKTAWDKRIVREAMTSKQDNGAMARFQFVNHPGKIGVVYFDKEYFHNKQMKQLPSNEPYTIPVFVEISKDGKQNDPIPVFDKESWGSESKNIFVIKALLPLGTNEYLVYAEDGSNSKMGKLLIKP